MGSCSAWMTYSDVNEVEVEEVEVGKVKEAGEGDKGGEGGAVVEFVYAFIAASSTCRVCVSFSRAWAYAVNCLWSCGCIELESVSLPKKKHQNIHHLKPLQTRLAIHPRLSKLHSQRTLLLDLFSNIPR